MNAEQEVNGYEVEEQDEISTVWLKDRGEYFTVVLVMEIPGPSEVPFVVTVADTYHARHVDHGHDTRERIAEPETLNEALETAYEWMRENPGGLTG